MFPLDKIWYFCVNNRKTLRQGLSTTFITLNLQVTLCGKVVQSIRLLISETLYESYGLCPVGASEIILPYFFSNFCFLSWTWSSVWWRILNGCGMGPLLVLVSPCFRKNVVVTCKIGSFLCSLDNLLQKNVIVFFFENQISKWRSFEKGAIFDLLFTLFSYQGKVTKIPSAHISLTYIHAFCSPYWLFLPYQFWKKYKFIRCGFSLVWFLVLILNLCHFGTINN